MHIRLFVKRISQFTHVFQEKVLALCRRRIHVRRIRFNLTHNLSNNTAMMRSYGSTALTHKVWMWYAF